MSRARLLQGDALAVLKTLPEESVRCCVTSPPYWGLRDYGTATWKGGSSWCDHRKGPAVAKDPRSTLAGTTTTQNHSQESWGSACGKCGAVRTDAQLGLERTPEQYVARLVEVFREVRRVLTKDGTLWLNLGDSYAASSGTGGTKSFQPTGPMIQGYTRKAPDGLKPKDLVGIPWRMAFALQADGWWLRSDIIWSKPNPMPESVTDRPTKSHEYLFLLSKSAKYYYDAAAIAEEATYGDHARNGTPDYVQQAPGQPVQTGITKRRRSDKQRGHSRRHAGFNDRWDAMLKAEQCAGTRNARSVWEIATQPYPEAHFATFPDELPRRCILAGSAPEDTVLDPFCGSGTTCAVAVGNGRAAIGIDLNPKYLELARHRIGPLLCDVEAA